MILVRTAKQQPSAMICVHIQCLNDCVTKLCCGVMKGAVACLVFLFTLIITAMCP